MQIFLEVYNLSVSHYLCHSLSVAFCRHWTQIFASIFAKKLIVLQLFLCIFFSSLKEFEIELEGSQTLRLLCYEKCYNKTKQNKEDGESTDRIMGKGQIPVRHDVTPPFSRPTATHY